MSGASSYIAVSKEQLYYLKWGSGSKLLVAFHGYNNEASIFSVFQPYLEKEYTVLSFDLPYHGASKWTDSTPITRNDFEQLINNLCKEYGAEKVSLLGYSMGGRVCLTIMEMMPEKIQKALLIAPDGLVPQPLYYFLTNTFIGRKLFSAVLRAPKFFFLITDWLHKKRLTDAARHKFVNYYMGSAESRKFLLQVWPCFRHIVPDRKKLKAEIKQYKIPVSIFMGSHDHIIPPIYGRNFQNGLNTVELVILEKGHRVFDEHNAREIAQHLL